MRVALGCFIFKEAVGLATGAMNTQAAPPHVATNIVRPETCRLRSGYSIRDALHPHSAKQPTLTATQIAANVQRIASRISWPATATDRLPIPGACPIRRAKPFLSLNQ
jgi:hypothetical protein